MRAKVNFSYKVLKIKMQKAFNRWEKINWHLKMLKVSHILRKNETIALVMTTKNDQYSNLHNFFSLEARRVIKEIKTH